MTTRYSLLALLCCTPALAQPTEPSPSASPAAATESPAPSPSPGAIMVPAPPMHHDPLAGYSNGGFFLRDPHDWFVLFPRGRMHIDSYFFLNRDGNGDSKGGAIPGTINNGPKDNRPKDTIFIRRARV